MDCWSKRSKILANCAAKPITIFRLTNFFQSVIKSNELIKKKETTAMTPKGQNFKQIAELLNRKK